MIPYKKDAGSKSDILFTVNLCLFTVVLVITIREYYKFSQFSLITVLFSFKIMKFFTIYNNAIKTVPQTAKDKEFPETHFLQNP